MSGRGRDRMRQPTRTFVESRTHSPVDRCPRPSAVPSPVSGDSRVKLLVLLLLSHLEQVLGCDHRRDRGMVGLHVFTPERHDLLVVLAPYHVSALTNDSLR